jgi:1-acyl-sn-glycerol-3-phosphate acyltransferase
MTAASTPWRKRLYFYLVTAGLRTASMPLCRPLEGAERLPDGPFILAANHRSLLDGVILVGQMNAVRRRAMHMIAYRQPFDLFFVGMVLRVSGCLPFERGEPQSRRQVLESALGYLRAGEPVGIFPEAHLSRTDTMRRGRPGVAMLALESGCPVVPVGIRGSERVFPPAINRPRPGPRASLEVGFPLDFSGRRDDLRNATPEERQILLTEVVTEVMEAIAALSGQTYPARFRRPVRRRRRGREPGEPQP